MSTQRISPNDLSGLFEKVEPLEGMTGNDFVKLLGVTATTEAPNDRTAVDGIVETVEQFIHRFCILPDRAYLTLAMWAVATHLADTFDAFPYIALLSPAKRCGKTRLLEVLEQLVREPWRGTAPSPAALYRMMETSPTLLLDEVEMLNGRGASETQQAILAILNAGHRQGATIPRCDGPKNEVRHFRTYGPKIFAAIGKLPDTLTDRSIIIGMQRRTSSQHVERFLYARAKNEATPIREALIKFALEFKEDVRATYEVLCAGDLPFLSDRDTDIWLPLFAVCTVAAPGRVRELKDCARTLAGQKLIDDQDDSLPLQLLENIREIRPAGCDRLESKVLLDYLLGIVDAPWEELDLTQRKMARYLRPFGVLPRNLREGHSVLKGYQLGPLQEAFTRYLGNVSATCATST